MRYRRGRYLSAEEHNFIPSLQKLKLIASSKDDSHYLDAGCDFAHGLSVEGGQARPPTRLSAAMGFTRANYG